ncbi:MAG: DNA-binding protein [Bacteroidales bacterium]
MAKKKVFALRLNEDLYTAVEQWAADEFRSTNGQLEWIISKALKDARRMSLPKTETEDEEKVQ